MPLGRIQSCYQKDPTFAKLNVERNDPSALWRLIAQTHTVGPRHAAQVYNMRPQRERQMPAATVQLRGFPFNKNDFKYGFMDYGQAKYAATTRS